MVGRNQELLRPLLRKASKAGHSITHLKSGHLRVTSPSGDHTTVSSTPGSAKCAYRFKSWLRQRGVHA